MKKTDRIRTIIVDDDSHWQMIIKNLINNEYELLLEGIFSSAEEAYEYLTQYEVDLVFLDMKIKDDNGIDLIKRLEKIPQVIIVSSFKEFAFEGYSISAIDYLTKPIDFEKFGKAVQKAVANIKLSKSVYDSNKKIEFDRDYILVKENLMTVKLNYSEVLYISALENYIKIITSAKSYVILTTLLQFERSIKKHPFLRVHRSYIINLNYLKSINKDILTLTDNTQIPLGEQYKNDVLETFVEGKMIKR